MSVIVAASAYAELMLKRDVFLGSCTVVACHLFFAAAAEVVLKRVALLSGFTVVA